MDNKLHPLHHLQVLLVLVLSVGAFGLPFAPTAKAANNLGVPIYLHHLPSNVTISGVQTSNILNTTTLWGGATQTANLRYNVANFTLYPALTSALTSIGTGTLALWINVNGAPGSLNATIYDASAAGQLAVVSTSQAITLNSSPNTPYKITLGFSINHVFSQSSTIKLSLTVTKVSVLNAWFDSATYPSAITIPVANIPRISLIATFNANLTSQSSFSLNWTASQRLVFIIVHVADPFGAYHVGNDIVTISGAGPTVVFTSQPTSLTTDPAAPEKLFETSWAYNSNLSTGAYVISSTANDTAGDQDTNIGNLYLTSTGSNQPPTQQPPGNTISSWYWLIAGALVAAAIGLLLAFLFLAKRRRAQCPKCHAKVSSKTANCPFCGTPVSPEPTTAKPS